MAEYEILTKEHMYVDEYIDGYARHERGRIYDVIEAETPGKAKYLFWKKHFCYDFIEDMKLIEMCRLHRCPRCKGQNRSLADAASDLFWVCLYRPCLCHRKYLEFSSIDKVCPRGLKPCPSQFH